MRCDLRTMHHGALPFALLLLATIVHAQNDSVQAAGAMRTALQAGHAPAVIQMRELMRPGHFGLGPLTDLRGELLLLDGRCLAATVGPDGKLRVSSPPDAGAPFFVHQQVENWEPMDLPDSVTTLTALDHWLTAKALADGAPFAFRLDGRFRSVDVHVLNVPEGTAVNSREEAHRWDARFQEVDRVMTVLGFFSTKHHGVFTHHGSNVHLHAVSAERDWMGHVEALDLAPGAVQLFIAPPQ